MALPAELRNMIYEHLLVSKPVIWVVSRTDQSKRKRPRPITHVVIYRKYRAWQDLDVTIMSASKAIHDEAKSFLYCRNTFAFDSGYDRASTLAFFLAQIGSRRHLLRHIALEICVEVTCRGDSRWNNTLDEFRIISSKIPTIKTVQLELWIITKRRMQQTTESPIKSLRAIDTLLRRPGTMEEIKLRSSSRFRFTVLSPYNHETPKLEAEMTKTFHREARELGWTLV
jgi:hypothetical protein